MVAPCPAVAPENTVTPYAMRKIFGMPLKPMVLGHLQSLAVLVDALLAALFIHIVMHDELAADAFK